MKVKTVRGFSIPEIGLGTYRMYGRECEKTVRNALDIGYRLIDTAQMYKNEKEVGDALYASSVAREEIFLTTKIWHTNLDYDDVIQSVEESLKLLRTAYVDLLLIHWPNDQYELQQTFEAMMMLKDQGKALQIGVSNFPAGKMAHVLDELRIPVVADQVEFHPFLDQLDLLDLSYEHDFVVSAYCPLARGKVLENETLRRIGNEYNKTPAQISLRWLIEQENVVAVPKSSNPEHLKENLDIYDFELSDEHFDEIDQLEKSVRIVNPNFAPDWNA